MVRAVADESPVLEAPMRAMFEAFGALPPPLSRTTRWLGFRRSVALVAPTALAS